MSYEAPFQIWTTKEVSPLSQSRALTRKIICTETIFYCPVLQSRLVFVYVLEKQICCKKSRFPSNIQSGILPIIKFITGDDDQKVITFDFCFTNVYTYLGSDSKEIKIFGSDLYL